MFMAFSGFTIFKSNRSRAKIKATVGYILHQQNRVCPPNFPNHLCLGGYRAARIGKNKRTSKRKDEKPFEFHNSQSLRKRVAFLFK